MTERLPNNGETAWGDILGANDGTGGFLRVSHNDDGTQKYPGESYLYAQADAASGHTSGTFNPTWTLLDVDGDDLRIDPGDAKLIEFLTTGWYIKEVEFNPTIEAPFGQSFQRSTLDFGETVSFGFPLYWLTTQGTYPVDTSVQLMITTEPTLWTAGQKMLTEIEATVSGGTWGYSGTTGFVRVVRVS